MGIVEKFIEEFDETIDDMDDDMFLVVSSTRIEGLVDLRKFQERYNVIFHAFSFEFPKKEKDRPEVVRYCKQWFDLDRIKKIINVFLEGVIELTIFEQDLFLIIKINEDYGIILAPKEENTNKYYSIWEMEYEWDSIFHEQSFGSDMIL